jgi:hypothetical protein
LTTPSDGHSTASPFSCSRLRLLRRPHEQRLSRSGRPAGPARIVYATNLPRRIGLYCASTLITSNSYDRVGAVKLTSAAATIIRGGSDILLAIEQNVDRSGLRPTLGAGHSWSASGYRSARSATAVRCWRGSPGFVLTTRLEVF